MNPTLQALVGEPEAFLRERWNRETVHRHAGLPELLTERDIRATIDCGLLVEPYFTVLPPEGRSPSAELSVERRVLNVKRPGFVHRRNLLAAFDDGSAIQLSRIEDWHHPVRELVEGLRPSFDTELHAYAVLSPADVTTATAHTGGSHLLVLQLDGEAEWTLTGNDEREQLLLRAGDVLYVPPGRSHLATAKGGNSLHVVVTIEEPSTGEITESLTRELRRRFKAHERYSHHHLMTAEDKAVWVRTAAAQYCAQFAAATATEQP
ncbi:JmjC domain-containing protein [Amycolatopsis sp. H20-H5]|uniref:JmjC domain-containing protein n=1 Tax=Amycolatopsis sp. H20-H5 TaxID=3046309 RepID=UPI002DB5BDF0|nr:cupin domain-containing protein [Amycolatopsis sp. H20-H5]MEC3976878.1 cupin domain-containing protein [Amycolatopsis sp. H20-H5]